MNMLDFIFELEKVIAKWPDSATWTLAQVSDYTGASIPLVVDIMSDVLDREIEVHETVTHTEAAKVLSTLRDRMAGQIVARQKRLDARRQKAMIAYDGAMEKVRVLQMGRNWRSAYKTLSYFVGCHEKDLPADLLSSLCGDCIRLGLKSEANLQELSQWVRKGVAACLTQNTAEGVEDAFDFIDAYGADLLDSDNGRRLVTNVMDLIRTDAAAFDLLPKYDSLVKELQI
jgi:hypothetical protein